ncbi:HAMP domain-containing histidine kinase [Clostridiaceae bacterium OttesenSCG-928-D20]|nr:HAMP domain-containing histidine kinase [Clostridiaceae bacterium OttesenSCG-928-D20]
MRYRDSSDFPLKLFFIGASGIALIIALGASLAFSRGLNASYKLYLLFMLASSLGGGFVLSLAAAFLQRRQRKESTYLFNRVNELERSIHLLEDATDKREEFIASFAHELKTPLTAIIGYADMLRSKDMSAKTRFTAAGYIFSEGKRLEALSLKLMDIIVAGKQSFEMKRVSASVFIREVAAVSVPSTGGDGLSLDIRSEPSEVLIEPDLFKTLLINLVDNARKASKKGQHVELYGKREDGGYAFYVRDYGRGMKKEDLRNITEPFYMIDKSRSREQNGAGLGLALCQRIAELHGTRLEYESIEGKGTTVRVFLKGAEDERA